MGRKAKRLRSRKAHLERQAAKQMNCLEAMMTDYTRRRREIEAEYRKATALTIRLEDFHEPFGDVFGVTVQFRPEMFRWSRSVAGGPDFVNLRLAARTVSLDVASKVEKLLYEFFQDPDGTRKKLDARR